MSSEYNFYGLKVNNYFVFPQIQEKDNVTLSEFSIFSCWPFNIHQMMPNMLSLLLCDWLIDWSILILLFKIVEVSGLVTHQTKHCKGKTKLSFCPRCSEAIPFEKFHAHIDTAKCHRKFWTLAFLKIQNYKQFYISMTLKQRTKQLKDSH